MEKDAPEPKPIGFACSSGKTEHSVTRSFVAEDGGRVIGYLCVSANTKCGLGVLNVIGVDPDTFSKGCGRRCSMPPSLSGRS